MAVVSLKLDQTQFTQKYYDENWRNIRNNILLKRKQAYLWRRRKTPHKMNVPATRIQPMITKLQSSENQAFITVDLLRRRICDSNITTNLKYQYNLRYKLTSIQETASQGWKILQRITETNTETNSNELYWIWMKLHLHLQVLRNIKHLQNPRNARRSIMAARIIRASLL